MTQHPDDEIVSVARGTIVEVELWEDLLGAAGIENKIVGTELSGSFGTAMPDSIELWVHRRDAARAEAIIREGEEKAGRTWPRRSE